MAGGGREQPDTQYSYAPISNADPLGRDTPKMSLVAPDTIPASMAGELGTKLTSQLSPSAAFHMPSFMTVFHALGSTIRLLRIVMQSVNSPLAHFAI